MEKNIKIGLLGFSFLILLAAAFYAFFFLEGNSREINECLGKYPFLRQGGCEGSCTGGREDYAFYSKNFSITAAPSYNIPDNILGISVALYSASGCEPCYGKFKIKNENEFREVNLGEFCAFVMKYNGTCNNCIEVFRAEKE